MKEIYIGLIIIGMISLFLGVGIGLVCLAEIYPILGIPLVILFFAYFIGQAVNN